VNKNGYLSNHCTRLDLKAATLLAIERLPQQFTLQDVMEDINKVQRKGYIPRWKVLKYLYKLVDRHQWLTTLTNCRGNGDSFYVTMDHPEIYAEVFLLNQDRLTGRFQYFSPSNMDAWKIYDDKAAFDAAWKAQRDKERNVQNIYG